MSDPGTDEPTADEPTWPTHCPTCGTELAHGTIDFDQTNENRAELQPGEMVTVDYCPNPDCPAKAGDRAEDRTDPPR